MVLKTNKKMVLLSAVTLVTMLVAIMMGVRTVQLNRELEEKNEEYFQKLFDHIATKKHENIDSIGLIWRNLSVTFWMKRGTGY